MKPIEKKEGFTPEYQPAEAYVNTVEYRLSTDFAEGMFSSCKDVTFGGQPALRVMCTSTPCTLTNWLEFIGTQNLDLNIPIHTKFLLYDPIKVLVLLQFFVKTLTHSDTSIGSFNVHECQLYWVRQISSSRLAGLFNVRVQQGRVRKLDRPGRWKNFWGKGSKILKN